MSKVPKQICVTGANGYIGSHVVRELLSAGAHVTATLRGAAEAKSAHLRALPGADTRLRIISADVLDGAVWTDVLSDCDALVHCATAVKFHAKNPQRDIVDVAVQGTENVLSAAASSPRTKDVVHLSSVAAIFSHEKPASHMFTANDWCDDANVRVNPYALGKTLSEKAAWRLAQPTDSRTGFRLCCLNPGYVLGPVMAKSHLGTSRSIIRDILLRKFPGCPPLNLNVVDVRDVATASLRALCMPDLSERLLLSAGSRWWSEMAAVLKAHFPDRKITVRVLPDWLLYLNALFDPRVSFSFLRRSLHRETLADGETAVRRLGMEYRPIEDTLVSTAESMVDFGVG